MTKSQVTFLKLMQAFASLHEAVTQLNDMKLENLDTQDLATIQSYYIFVKQKLLEQEQKFTSLSINSTSAMPKPLAEKDSDTSFPAEQETLEQKTDQHKKTKQTKKTTTPKHQISATKSKKQPTVSETTPEPPDEIKKMFDEL